MNSAKADNRTSIVRYVYLPSTTLTALQKKETADHLKH